MTYRYMRVIVMFDLPTTSSEHVREYTKFRKLLIKSGFMMMQESVYTKFALNTTVANAVVENLRKHRPSEGLVQVLTMTEKQFQRIEFIVGTSKSNVLDSDERLVIL